MGSSDGIVGFVIDRSREREKFKFPRLPFEACLGVALGVERIGEVSRLMGASGRAALFVGGIIMLIRLRRGVCVGRDGYSSARTGLLDLGETLSPGVGQGTDSLDNRSTSVNFASPREDGVCVS